MTDNELIAEFMGLPLTKKEPLFSGGVKKMKTVPFMNWHYHDQWNHLMAVVEKIEEVSINRLKFHVLITVDGCKIAHREREGSVIPPGEICIEFCDSKIESVYRAVIAFIKWYNEQTPTP